ncbi:Putative Glycosyl hydrolase family 17 protein [Phytophthora palmivora]|uniref:glucan endo-1,3-beta-D-glucosidase n=1 Tax=Phytophthora palmivora TaxID=4796 RepID=A0A2P4YS31_9STRA|nr:Putative Glycosyl hydrolase family 17 protein [Phytophthora palmivora]
METLVQVTKSVRFYGLGDCDQSTMAVPAAINAGLSVSLGVWVNDDEAVFESEFTKLQTLLKDHSTIFSQGNIVSIHVGSEAIYRKEVTAAKNIEYLQRVKALLTAYGLESVPVTIAEIGDVYLAHPELTDAVDFVEANGFPFWERINIQNAVNYLKSRMTPLFQQALARDKKVVIGETGWASGGSSPRASFASPSNAATYFRGFYNWAIEQGIEFYYFEGFDEEWKIAATDDTVEGYFGLFHADGTLKTEIADLQLGPSCTNEDASAGGYTPVPTTRPEGCRVNLKKYKMVHVTGTSLILAALITVATTSIEAVAFNCPDINYNIRTGADWAIAEDKCKPASQIAKIHKMCSDNGGTADIPLTIIDVDSTYLEYPDLIDERIVDLTATYDGDKSVVIGEIGWVTNGSDPRASEATPENSAEYFHDFYLQAQEQNISFYYFSAFDEAWKGTDTVEAYFGLFYANGEMKPIIAELELDDEVTATGSSTKREVVTPSPEAEAKEETVELLETERKSSSSIANTREDDEENSAVISSDQKNCAME